MRDDGYFSPLEKKQYEIDLFADAGKTPRLETPRVGETRDELAHRAMHAIDSIKMNHSSEIRWKKGKLIGSGAFGCVVRCLCTFLSPPPPFRATTTTRNVA